MKRTPQEKEASWLKRHGFDGLYFPGECACKRDDLYLCGERQDGCKPGHLMPCPPDCSEHDWHIGKLPAPRPPEPDAP